MSHHRTVLRIDGAPDKQTRAYVRQLFGTDEDQDEQETPPHLSVPNEGGNPPAAITDEDRLRDFAKRMFDPHYAFYQQRLTADEKEAR